MADRFPEIASSLASIGKEFHVRGWVVGTSGNLSAVVHREPLRLAMTPSGVDKGELRAEQILMIDEYARVVGDHHGRPSDESPLHLRIVNERGAGAVHHTHSIWNTILANLHAADGGVSIEAYGMVDGLHGVTTHEYVDWMQYLQD